MRDADRGIVVHRLDAILESIELIGVWSCNVASLDDFMSSPERVMAFNACVMRLQVIGEQVGRLLRLQPSPLQPHKDIPWLAIYDMRNFISHQYESVDERIVFSTIKNDLPRLEQIVRQIKLEWEEQTH